MGIYLHWAVTAIGLQTLALLKVHQEFAEYRPALVLASRIGRLGGRAAEGARERVNVLVLVVEDPFRSNDCHRRLVEGEAIGRMLCRG